MNINLSIIYKNESLPSGAELCRCWFEKVEMLLSTKMNKISDVTVKEDKIK